MKIALASDLHNEFYRGTPPPLPKVEADVLVLAGDIETVKSHNYEWWQDVSKKYPEIVYVHGNHEYYGSYYKNRPYLAFPNNVATGRCIPAISFRIGIYKWTIGTMWTDLSLRTEAEMASMFMNDYKVIKYSLDERRPLHPNDTTREWAAFQAEIEYAKPDIVVSHHLPSYGSVPSRFKDDRLNCAFATEMDMRGVKLWMHGHTHDACDYEKDGCRIVCNPKGYPGENSGEYKLKVIEI